MHLHLKMKKILIIVFYILVFIIPAFASDDELFVMQGDDELMFVNILDDELNLFSNTRQNQQSGIESQNAAAPSGSSRAGNDNPEEVINQETAGKQSEETIIRGNEENINLLGRENIFDINIRIDSKSKNMQQGGEIMAVVSLLNLGNSGRINTNIHYWIEGDSLIYEEYENVPVETQREFIKRFDIEKNLSPGTYTLNADLEYEGQIEPAYSSDTFQVSEKSFNYFYMLLLAAILLLLLLAERKFSIIKRIKSGKF